MSSPASSVPLDLTGIEGDYVLRGWTRPRVAAVIGSLTLAALGVLGGVLLDDRQILVLSLVLLLLIPVVIWRTRHRDVTTTIAQDGITTDYGTGQRGRTRTMWADAQEVYVAGAWQAHSTVLTTANQRGPSPRLG